MARRGLDDPSRGGPPSVRRMGTTMDDPNRRATAKLLLSRRGLVFLPSPRGGATTREVEATLLEFVALGYAGSTRLRTALEALSTEQLAHVREEGVAVLAAKLGANQVHKPL